MINCRAKTWKIQQLDTDENICNGVTACVTRLVTLIVRILRVVILERPMLYLNVGSNGREQ